MFAIFTFKKHACRHNAFFIVEHCTNHACQSGANTIFSTLFAVVSYPTCVDGNALELVFVESKAFILPFKSSKRCATKAYARPSCHLRSTVLANHVSTNRLVVIASLLCKCRYKSGSVKTSTGTEHSTFRKTA